MRKELIALVLAAGKGVRFKSEKTKLLHPLLGKPLLRFSLDCVFRVRPAHVYVVVGHQKDEIMKLPFSKRVDFIIQKQQLGTAHAVLAAKKMLQKNLSKHVLIMNGDLFLLQAKMLNSMWKLHRKEGNSLTFLSAEVENPSGLGRIIHTKSGGVKIVEEKANSTLTVPAGDDHWAALMSWEHVRSMQREGASFGSHTVEHYLLDQASSDEARRELADSKAEIEARTGRPCSSIAYPVGRYTQDLAKMAQELGYTSGLTTVEGVANFGDPAMTLPRIGIPAVPLPQVDLLARTTGLSRSLSIVRTVLTPGKWRRK